ncbi:MAG: glycosyltransferase [Thermoplasmatota archaeon]|nr:glycosyltransferase [Candidatus Thermoplasmatota archaeon]
MNSVRLEDEVKSRGSAGEGDKPTERLRVRALFLVDDLSRYGGVRTRVSEELNCVVDSLAEDAYVISRCNIKNIEAIGSAVRSLKDEIGGKRMGGFSFPKIPHGGLPIVYELSFLLNTALLGLFVIPLALVRRINIVYGHNNELGALSIIMARILRVQSVVDLHGVEVDEYLEKYPNWRRHRGRTRFWKCVEGFVLRNADTIVCVSSAHRQEIRNRLGSDRRTYIVPCFADEAAFDPGRFTKETVRSTLGISPGEVVFVYSGLVPVRYDEFNPIFFFSHLGDVSGKRLIVLAAFSESSKRTADQIPQSMRNKVIVVSVPRHNVPEYLSACDVGILLRRASIINHVASPTKFAEYLLCGLPVVITENLGDASSLVKKDSIGIVVSETHPSDPLPEDNIRALLSEETRTKARAAGLANLSRKSCRPIFLEVFEATIGSR